MKSIIVVLLILCIGLAGCNSTLTNVENSSSVIASGSNVTNVSDTSNMSDTSSNSSQTYQSSIPTVTEGPEPVYFSFTAKTIEDFVLWSKTKGTVKVGLNSAADNPLNQTYLKWIKTQNSLLVPKLKTPLKPVYWVKPHEKQNGYFTMLSLEPLLSQVNNKNNKMRVFVFGLDKNLQNKDIDYVTENWVLTEVLTHRSESVLHTSNCIFGKYYYFNSKESNQPNSGAWFIKDQYLIYMSAYIGGEDVSDDWQDEYFDYFDFETVSLK